jgi:hypothetical protein
VVTVQAIGEAILLAKRILGAEGGEEGKGEIERLRRRKVEGG